MQIKNSERKTVISLICLVCVKARHRASSLQQMQKALPNVDCIVEVHDARIPFSGRNPRFQEMLTMVKPHILVLNKMDVADMNHAAEVKAKLTGEQGIRQVIHTSCKQNPNTKRQLLSAVIQLIESGDRFNRSEIEHYNILVIGVPNVGKSSLINSLRQTALHKGGKATAVGAMPGITRSVLEKIKISERPKVYVFDTPGIMLPCIPNMDVGMKLALCATLKDHLIGSVTVADYMLFWLNKHAKFDYVKFYGLTEAVDDVYYFLTQIAKNRNLTLKVKSPAGGVVIRPHFDLAAQIVLRDFQAGRLGKVNLDVDFLFEDSENALNSDTCSVVNHALTRT